MRTELINFENYFWGLSKDDIIYTADLTKSFFKAYVDTLKLPSKKFTPEVDLYLSSHIREAQFSLQFGIWRLQSVFESLVKSSFKIETKGGLQKIISMLEKKGFKVIEKTELFQWSNLRNNLSHSAPERFNPAPSNLFESDIDEYSALLLKIYNNLESQL